jgi:hypothetical protein
MQETNDDEPITLDEIVETVISEDLPRDGQVLPNIEKWLMANAIILGSNSPTEVDPMNDFSMHYIDAYRNKTGDELLAYQLLADLQSDIYEAMMRSGVTGPLSDEVLLYRYAMSMLYYRKLLDKYMALDLGLTEVRHLWLH